MPQKLRFPQLLAIQLTIDRVSKKKKNFSSDEAKHPSPPPQGGYMYLGTRQQAEHVITCMCM